MLINLSSWSDEPFAEWLAYQISDKHDYAIPFAKAGVEQGQFHLYLDGLDEIRSAHRNKFPARFDEFVTNHGSPGIVIASREKEYRELTTRLRINEAIRLQSLTPERIDAYLSQFGSELDGLREALSVDSSLATIGQSPLMLTLMIKVFSERQPSSGKLDSEPQTPAESREGLMAAYVAMMFEKQRGTHG